MLAWSYHQAKKKTHDLRLESTLDHKDNFNINFIYQNNIPLIGVHYCARIDYKTLIQTDEGNIT